ncbi:MAG TPA: hypothetical protein VMT03_08235 [Polyangia bacterium]|nr:hypothetical protein [Polyangia bacterium]
MRLILAFSFIAGCGAGSGSNGLGGSGGSTGTGGATGGASGGVTGAGGVTPGTGGHVAGTGGQMAGTGGQVAGTGGSSAGGMAGQPSGGASGGAGSGGAAESGTGGGAAGASGALPTSYSVENTGADCPQAPAPPAFSALTSIANLPDPFLMISGTRISKIADWRCRRAEISSQIQYWGTGPKGAPPAASSLTATFSGSKLTVTVTQGGATITLSSTITTPSGSGPFPLVIGMNTPTGSLPTSLFSGVATMTFDSTQLVSDGFNVTRGAGTYFTMYPDRNTGAMIEWAWGVSRLIDGLYATASQNKIDLGRIAVTGCSYQGKMALYAGAFDDRIALTIPEESGGGGEASWRFDATQTGTEDLDHAQGTAWYASNLKQFTNADAPKLPYDQHELVATVAPRAILAVENTGIDYLGAQGESVSMRAAKEVYKALGIPDRLGYTQTQAPAHCSFPTSVQGPDVQAFVDKFLLQKSTANTSIARDAYNTDLTKWVTWSTPALQ